MTKYILTKEVLGIGQAGQNCTNHEKLQWLIKNELAQIGAEPEVVVENAPTPTTPQDKPKK